MPGLVMARSLLNLADLVALPFGNAIEHARSASKSSPKLCDSGYSSENDQGILSSLTMISGTCPNKHADKLQPSDRPEKKNDCIVIRHEHMLYGSLALSILGLIDKNLIAPVVMGMAGVALLIPLILPTIGLEQVLDLSAFRFQWKREMEVRDVVEYVDREVLKEVEKPVYHEVVKYVDREVVQFVDREAVKYLDREVVNYVDREVIKYVNRDVIKEVEKSVHYYIIKTEIVEKSATRAETIFTETPTPAYANAGVQVDGMEYSSSFTRKVAITEGLPVERKTVTNEVLPVASVEQNMDGQPKKNNRKHRAGKKQRKQKTASLVSAETLTITAPPVDQTSTSAATKIVEEVLTTYETPINEKISSVSLEEDSGVAASAPSTTDADIQSIFIRTTAAQNEGMRIAQEARDRTRKPGGIPPQIEKVKDERETDLPPHEHDTYKDLVFRTVADMNAADQEYLTMPPPGRGSPATQQGFDRNTAIRDTFFFRGEELQNPHTWGETPIKHLFVSIPVKGVWLYVTPEASYVFRWHVENSVWYCEDYGFGFHQTELKAKTEPLFEYFYADLTVPNEDVTANGARRVGSPEGPFWAQAVADCAAEVKKQMKAEQKSQEAAQEMQQEIYEQQIKAKQFKLHVHQQEEQRRAACPAPQMPKQFDQDNPAFRTAQQKWNEHRASRQSQQTPQMPKQGDYDDAQYWNAQQSQQSTPPQSRPKARTRARAPKMTPQQTGSEHARKAAE
ncbi:hypothetical protein HBH56_108710 [Parastagonospora nodorum]|uniref:Band 7 domain-containing protein n=1 Tax=Phaeosphaeria nodorum (strain SN15 / ATCC MYA-4574 / FGSC 10173) TaxID=321614 RepID=A0A7U2I7Q7_PHANO|nr:hypothetical protein HBH56_108710 [Parastagonospora nodorum]QRD03217.1 hypothetical protein JI435_099870 [Parastagonospora nodorum SN15]KAH3922234.1 hypothetical protein HBH54_225810 [Parastagonospora nodorum]KAH4115990.1 hypothetical protein HBH47_173270 [Parastagonospora nodorum]KAH4138543.1 hypothetical protein HBH45_104040 [Parastagonospora nodorum]